ncbi:serpin B [Bacteroides zoogleoformans]|uniref:Serpin domain-containing protein n=1 Tax=Bacteroides zoogleoformans TaxID=28119 RepID=A0ABM6TAC8_9BACE|nr:serpin family protein [Bacteroides zoogleoformans]AVM53256.1 hypothetical protein C4H11_10230 [Bacteroides zoogleoformans]TWJ11149.1 serpin B [Bacteroides zoogleoformans]
MKKYLFLNLCLCLCLFGCQKDEQQDEEGNGRKTIPLTRTEKEISSQHVGFAFEYFKAVNALKGSEDKIVVSPLSASFAMTMMANGAENETLEEMKKALRISNFTLEEVNTYNKKLMEQLATLDKKATLLTANSFWMNSWFEALPQFKNTLEANYDAEMKQVDFATALPAINQWCAEKTNGHVKEILTELDKKSRFVLLNALYFKSEWAEKFREEDTTTENFTNSDGEITPNVKYMNNRWENWYYKNDLFALASLPFGNGAFRMQFLLPNEGKELEQCINALDEKFWEEYLLERSYAELVLKIPKYKVYTRMEQKEALKTMGVKRVFEANAELGKLASKRSLDEELTTWQACSFGVDEEGAVAAAVTSWNGMDMLSLPGPVVEFFVTRPFLFMVTEQSTGAFLFIGKVNKP